MSKSAFEIVLTGGLGNQLFGWALGFSASKLSGLDCRFNASYIIGRSYDLGFYGIEPYYGRPYKKIQPWHTVINRMMQKINLNYSLPWYWENSFRFDSRFLQPKKKITYYGYFQSYKYFCAFSSEIRSFLNNKSVFSSRLNKSINEIRSSHYYAVHIRRGDYLNSQHYHGLTKDSYFLNAKKLILQIDPKARFILFSDSPDLASAEVPWVEYRPDITNSLNSPETLIAMSSSNGIIGSNSSFSWWAAFLMQEQNIKIFPKPWFNNDKINTEDLLLDTWIQLDIS